MKLPQGLNLWLAGPVGAGRGILLLIAAGGTVALLVAGIDRLIVGHQRSSYVLTPCYMESSAISQEAGRGDRNAPGWIYVPIATYRYEVNGQSYTSRQVSSRDATMVTRSAAEAFLQKYGPGADAECWVDPGDPEEAMLVLPTADQPRRLAKAGGFALLMAIVGLVALQIMLGFDTAPPVRRPRAPGWGEIDSGPDDALARTRQILKERMESMM